MKKILFTAMLLIPALVSCSYTLNASGSAAAGIPSETAEIKIRSPIDKETAGFISGEWVVTRFLGFTAITKDDIEWPDGEKIIGKTVVITERLYSSKDFGPDYSKYAVEIDNPEYEVTSEKAETEFSRYLDANADESLRNLTDSDKLMMISIGDPKDGLGYATLYTINGNRLILSLNCDYFELEKPH
jgi:hypothetical protein